MEKKEKIKIAFYSALLGISIQVFVLWIVRMYKKPEIPVFSLNHFDWFDGILYGCMFGVLFYLAIVRNKK